MWRGCSASPWTIRWRAGWTSASTPTRWSAPGRTRAAERPSARRCCRESSPAPPQAALVWAIHLTISRQYPENGCLFHQVAAQQIGTDPTAPLATAQATADAVDAKPLLAEAPLTYVPPALALRQPQGPF